MNTTIIKDDKVKLIVDKKDIRVTVTFDINNLKILSNQIENNKLTIVQMQEFISRYVRIRSPKTNNLIKVNTFKWKKSELNKLIKLVLIQNKLYILE